MHSHTHFVSGFELGCDEYYAVRFREICAQRRRRCLCTNTNGRKHTHTHYVGVCLSVVLITIPLVGRGTRSAASVRELLVANRLPRTALAYY